MNILGIDPGFAALGLALYDTEAEAFTWAHCVHTKKDPDVSAAEDLFVRCEALAASLELETPDVICVEAMSYPRNASSATKLGASHGVVAALNATVWGASWVELLSPLKARKVVTGLKKPTEQDAHDAVRTLHTSIADLTKDFRKASLPHVLDAAVQVAAYLQETE